MVIGISQVHLLLDWNQRPSSVTDYRFDPESIAIKDGRGVSPSALTLVLSGVIDISTPFG